MKDLKICCENENGDIIKKDYRIIIDFLDEMKSDNIDAPMLDYSNVEAMFFENPLITKKFDTIWQLVDHCNGILR